VLGVAIQQVGGKAARYGIKKQFDMANMIAEYNQCSTMRRGMGVALFLNEGLVAAAREIQVGNETAKAKQCHEEQGYFSKAHCTTAQMEIRELDYMITSYHFQ
jgi:hypothetical protein